MMLKLDVWQRILRFVLVILRSWVKFKQTIALYISIQIWFFVFFCWYWLYSFLFDLVLQEISHLSLHLCWTIIVFNMIALLYHWFCFLTKPRWQCFLIHDCLSIMILLLHLTIMHITILTIFLIKRQKFFLNIRLTFLFLEFKINFFLDIF